MKTRIGKLAVAALMAVPLVGAVGVSSAHADDCDQPYGAVTSHPTCDEVGIPFRFHRHHHHHGGGWDDPAVLR